MTVILYHKDLAPNGTTIGKERSIQLLQEGWESRDVEKVEPPEVFVCDVCEKDFKLKMHLENHKRSHK